MSPRPLRIAMISLHTSPIAEPGAADAGGMNVVVLEQAKALGRAGQEVEIFTRRTAATQPSTVLISPGVRLHHLEAGPCAPLAKSAMEQVIAPFRAALLPRLSAGGFDVVHAHHWFSAVAVLGCGLPTVSSFHSVAAPEGAELAAGEPPESPGRIAGERRAARESDLLVVGSQAEARTVAERYGSGADGGGADGGGADGGGRGTAPMAIVLPGVDVDLFRPGPRTQPPELLWAGRLQPLKAPELALEILARVRRARLILAGGPSADFPDEAAALRERATQLGVADRVELPGPLSRVDLAARLRQASLLLLTSWSETFGLVALEAQASGTPVLAWEGAGGVADAVGPGGMLCATRDAEDWAARAAEILQHPEAAAAAARAFAAGRTWGASASELLGRYRRLLQVPAAADPWALVERARRPALVHAHPDDEALATGALAASLTDPLLVTATGGEEGEVVPGVLDAADPRSLVEVRAAELAASCRALGIAQHLRLGAYRDSGMRWVADGIAGPSPTAGPESLTMVPIDEPVADLVAALGEHGADLVLSYDDLGTYGHPDHLRVHQICAMAARELGIPFVEVASPGAADAKGFAWRDLSAHRAGVLAALGCYRTQLTVIGEDPPRVRHVGGQQEQVGLRVGLRVHR